MKKIGYNMISKLAANLEENQIDFEYEPSDIIESLYKNKEDFLIESIAFKHRIIDGTHETLQESTPNDLFRNLRNSLRKSSVNKD